VLAAGDVRSHCTDFWGGAGGVFMLCALVLYLKCQAILKHLARHALENLDLEQDNNDTTDADVAAAIDDVRPSGAAPAPVPKDDRSRRVVLVPSEHQVERRTPFVRVRCVISCTATARCQVNQSNRFISASRFVLVRCGACAGDCTLIARVRAGFDGRGSCSG
jgi:hypothetical protein